MKTCTKCGFSKELIEFNRQKGRIAGYRSHCKTCNKVYYNQNRNKILKYQKIYFKVNKSKLRIKAKNYIKKSDKIMEVL